MLIGVNLECPCCHGLTTVLIKHHWYETDNIRHEKMICYTCNTFLKSCNFGLANHVLPPWEQQLKAYKENRYECPKCGNVWSAMSKPIYCNQCHALLWDRKYLHQLLKDYQTSNLEQKV